MASTSDINSIPKKYIPVPFANGADSAYVNNIPQTRASGDPQNKATWNAGFPPITMQPVNADGTGGIPPSGADMNGVLNTLSSHAYNAQYGVSYDWDSNIASNLGGYPSGAIVAYPVGSNANKTLYLSLQENNTSTPTSGAWKLLFSPFNPISIYPDWSRAISWTNPNSTFQERGWFSLVYQGGYGNRLYLNGKTIGWAYARGDDYGSVMCSFIPVKYGDVLSGNGTLTGSVFIPAIG